MSLTLILTRHAKSDWGNPALDDFDRPLNPRGRKSAPAIGGWLNREGYAPDIVVVSGARRTVETWTLMSKALPPGVDMRSDPALYHAGAETILKVLKAQSARSVMLIGHNPGFAEFAGRFAREPADHARFYDYPTCATTVFRVARDRWSEAGWGEADVAAFTIPRELL